MQNFPILTIIFILLWIFFSFKVALIILSIGITVYLYYVIRDLYRYNPRRSGFKTEGNILRENLTKNKQSGKWC